MPDEGIERNIGMYINTTRSLCILFHTLGRHNATSWLKIQFYLRLYVWFGAGRGGGRDISPERPLLAGNGVSDKSDFFSAHG